MHNNYINDPRWNTYATTCLLSLLRNRRRCEVHTVKVLQDNRIARTVEEVLSPHTWISRIMNKIRRIRKESSNVIPDWPPINAHTAGGSVLVRFVP